MLILEIPMGAELYDDAKNEFVEPEKFVLELEHSLVALSKWEETFEKPFLGHGEKTTDEVISYLKCMALTPNVPPEIYDYLTNEHYEKINEYLNRKMTATWFTETPGTPRSSEIITSELIYYWMSTFQVAKDFEMVHLNKLFTQIRVHSEKNTPAKKKTPNELRERTRRLNAQRRQQAQSNG